MICTIPAESIRKIRIYVNSSKMSMGQVKKAVGCQYIINAGLYNMATFKPVNMLTVDGVVLSAGGNPYGYAIDGSKIVFSYENNVKYPSFIGAYPLLVRDGKATGAAAPAGLDGYKPRSAVGLKSDGSIVMLCYQTNRSLDGVADELVQAGCVTAINLDGGGSSQCNFDGKGMTSSRIVHNYLCVWTEENEVKPTGNHKYTVCIDAGHGATCSNGSPDGTFQEHEFALDITNRVKAILERHGVGVVMTRTNGTDVSLPDRCNISNKAQCDYFVSIHSNALGTDWNDANGWEIYCVALGGNAEKLAKAIRLESATLGLKDRGIKTANYTVLKDTDCPAVLIEHGFHTNKADCEKLKSDTFRTKCAEADAKGILSVLGIQYIAEQNKPTEAELARQWAIERGISDGTNPENPATREQVWTMLYRALS